MKESGREDGSFTLKSLVKKASSSGLNSVLNSGVKNPLTIIQSGRTFSKKKSLEEEKHKDNKNSERSEQSHEANELSEMVNSGESHSSVESSSLEESYESREIEEDQVHKQAKIKRREKQQLLGDIANINQLFTNEDIPEIERSTTFGYCFTLIYILLIFFFMISFLAEVRIKEPHDILGAFLDTVETKPFDADGNRYKDITSVKHVADFIKLQLLNEIYDEKRKKQINETSHYIREFNYFMGMRMISERDDKLENIPAQNKRGLYKINQTEEFSRNPTTNLTLNKGYDDSVDDSQRFLAIFEKEYFFSDTITFAAANNLYSTMVSDGVFGNQYK